ncbi:MAG TPA: hypothetical protein VHU84_17005 [Lacipirellulaceae bacterium]|nr:hypothetical protein [Lacipirellulaceae bacterium]
MKMLTQSVWLILALFIGLASPLAQAREGVLDAIPPDVVGFAVVHNLADASRSIDGVAKLVHAPAPDLLDLAKRMHGIQKGVNEQGDLAVVLTGIDPAPKVVVLVPMSDAAEFFSALDVKEPTTGVVEVQLSGRPALVGRKGGFAALALPTDRDVLEKFLASSTNLTTDAPLATWLDTNKVSVVVTTNGIKQLVPKLANGIKAIQAQIRQVPGVNGSSAADGLNLYLDLLTAAEPEVEQFGLGVRIDSAQTVDLVKRVKFTPNGKWAQWSASAKPATEDLLAGFPAGPYAAAMGGVVPPGAMEHMMKFSVQMMQKQPQYKLSPEQAQRYLELSNGMTSGVHAMRMVLGVPKPEAGLYSNMSAMMTVDDSKRFMQDYENSIANIHKFAEEAKDAAIPVSTSRPIKIGETDGLEVSIDFSSISKLTPGGQDSQKMLHRMMGTSDKLTVYVAPADEHTVLMVYTSLDRMKEALEFFRSKQPGLAGDAGVTKVAAALPPGSQVVGYFSLREFAKVVGQFAVAIPSPRAIPIPDFPDSPPIGMAVKISPAEVEGHLVVTAETLSAIGEVVAKAHGGSPRPLQ